MNIWSSETPTSINRRRDTTRTTETARRHAIETHDRDLRAVQALELKLEIPRHWTSEDAEWQEAGRLVAMCKYQRALDVLEGLIVARMFELTKMNQSQTGSCHVYSGSCHVYSTLATTNFIQAMHFASISARRCKHGHQPSEQH